MTADSRAGRPNAPRAQGGPQSKRRGGAPSRPALSARNRPGKGGSGTSNARTPMTLSRPVFFVGFMGAGKTSVARRLARTCAMAAVDMDTYLERREGKRVAEIFDESGEEGFRAIETSVLEELAAKEPSLISCGGGVVLRPENREILREGGYVVFLRVTADEAASRIRDTSSRPLFNDIESARQRCQDRMPLYEEVADVVVDTAGKSVGRLAWDVRAILEKEGILCQQPA